MTTVKHGDGGRIEHNRNQEDLFDRIVTSFIQPVPDEVLARLRVIVAAAEITPASAVLDVGTGTGVSLPLIKAYQPRRIVACDLSESMLAVARPNHPDVEFHHSDVMDLPREAGPFDVIICNATFGNVWDQAEVLTTFSALLDDEGRVVISHPLGRAFLEELRTRVPGMVRHPLPTRAELAELASGAFTVRRFIENGDIYLAVLARN